jgi:hypothetical protein
MISPQPDERHSTNSAAAVIRIGAQVLQGSIQACSHTFLSRVIGA